MKFILATLVGLAAAAGDGSCAKDVDCTPDDNGESQRCATMTMSNFSVDQCVAEILCGETMELEGVEMSYNCFDSASGGNGATKIVASIAALAATLYAL